MRKHFSLVALVALTAALLPAQMPPQEKPLATVEAMSDFYALYGVISAEGKQLASPADMKGHISPAIEQKLRNNLQYRVAFIGQATARAGFASGQTTMANLGETINALTGFLLLVEGNGDIQTWTVKEVSKKYERLLQTSWQNTNPTLFILMLQNYCAFKRGELW